MIEIRRLTKRFGRRAAVDDLSFRVRAGEVVGFLGPNGAGKTTTIRVLLGLVAPDGGTALVAGRPYRELERPLRQVGAVLDAGAVHGGLRVDRHLAWLAASSGLPRGRVEEVLATVGLDGVAGTRVRKLSLGMRQRLAVAAALLGDPAVLVLDEPVNGLDPEGIHWIRGLIRDRAAQGCAVLVSSHLMGEMSLTADRLVVVGQGRLLADAALADLVAASGEDTLEAAYLKLTGGAGEHRFQHVEGRNR